MMRLFLISVFSVFICHFSSAQLPAGFIRERIATGLNPTSIAQTLDGRIFITEKDGSILVIRNHQVLDDPLVTIEVDDSNERGLGHIVFHPDFELNGYFYVFYSVTGQNFNRVSRFTANGDKAIPGSEKVIIDLDHLGTDIHNGGAMVFGFDGLLYIATGEGGQSWLSDDLSSTNGKILRLDENGQAVPENPWFDLNIGRSNTVYASGLRNPFTMAIHPLTGEIYANDVGGNEFEEVNRIERGGFYGWPLLEGKKTNQDLPEEYVDPVFQYSHDNNYCSIVGSAFYNPQHPQFPQEYIGRYFYSDYCTGHIRMLDIETGIDKGIFISDGDRVVDIMVSHEGSLYYLERKGVGDGSAEDNTGTNEGVLWKVTYTGAGTPFISVQPETILVSEGESAHFNINASGEMPITYTWFLNGVEADSINQSTFQISNTTIDHDSATVSVIVTNVHGVAASDTVLLRVTSNHRPLATILSPSEDTKYNGGDTITFSGSAFDEEDGNLPVSSFSWKIDFHHGVHSHPGMPWVSGIINGQWVIPDVGETSSEVWYRIYLKVIDSQGFPKIVYRDIYPNLGSINITSIPTGLKIKLDGAPVAAPFVIDGVAGISRYITAPHKQVLEDSIYFFEKWNDGSKEHTRLLRTSQEEQTFTGIFKGFPLGKGYGLTGSYFDNPDLNGEPVLVRIDSILNNQFHYSAPDPLLPKDFFSIKWEGFLQAYKSGEYKLTVFADDGVIVLIDQQPVIEQWSPGVHNLSGTRYFEEGRLYPISVRMYDDQYNSQLRLRWSSPDFSEEVIPSSQLYPRDYLADKHASGFISIKNITSEEFQLWTESYKNVYLHLSIVSVTGQEVAVLNQFVPVGQNIITININQLPPGIYFLRGINHSNGVKEVIKFVKVK